MLKVIVSVVTLAALPALAMADDGDKMKGTPAQTQGAVSMEALDTDKDGKISLTEAAADAALTEKFSTADKNADGYLDSGEFKSLDDAKPKS
jgi:Ca2+-binding EF-hand superfamily protein